MILRPIYQIHGGPLASPSHLARCVGFSTERYQHLELLLGDLPVEILPSGVLIERDRRTPILLRAVGVDGANSRALKSGHMQLLHRY
jgi:hypothetical protein